MRQRTCPCPPAYAPASAHRDEKKLDGKIAQSWRDKTKKTGVEGCAE
ncbi:MULTISPECIES: hypothetical protein [Rothia]|nr:hypothetical protein [Rothia nasimurium]